MATSVIPAMYVSLGSLEKEVRGAIVRILQESRRWNMNTAGSLHAAQGKQVKKVPAASSTTPGIECGWKDGDRGGLAQSKLKEREPRKENHP
jgi:hypothetical protein